MEGVPFRVGPHPKEALDRHTVGVLGFSRNYIHIENLNDFALGKCMAGLRAIFRLPGRSLRDAGALSGQIQLGKGRYDEARV